MTQKSKAKKKQLPSDGLFKKVMSEKIAAQEFLEHHLPEEFKTLVDLTQITIEKESYVEDSLRKKLSDIVYSVKTKDNEEAFIYVLIEAEVSSDYWISLKLWKYMLLLLERHQDKPNNKLPYVAPMIVYHGKTRFTAPRSLWKLFHDEDMAKRLMGDQYLLIDLQSMSDNEIVHKKHLGMLEYFLKHAHQRDMLRLWDEFLTQFKTEILIDKEMGYVYIKWFLWYTDSKVAVGRHQELSDIISRHLTEDHGEGIMKTIADRYIEEGYNKAALQFDAKFAKLQEEKRTAEAKLQEEKITTAKNLLKAGVSADVVASSTGLSKADVDDLKS